MNSSVFRISLDVHEAQAQAMLRVKKGDTARRISISLTENGKPYRITEDCAAVFTAKKPDGNILFNDCIIRENGIEYTLTAQSTAVVGILACEIRLYGANFALITSPRFCVYVEDTVYSDGDVVESSDEFSALARMITEAANATNAANDAAGDIREALENGEFQGKDYVLTEADRAEIARMAAEQVPGGGVDEEQLTQAVEAALREAKESGEFDGADGRDGVDGRDGQDGADGGHYTPRFTQMDANTVKVSFTPSREGMPAVSDITITLPAGRDGTSVTHEWDGTVLKITSANRTTSADLKGKDGKSPVIELSGTEDGTTIRVVNADGGEEEVFIRDGKDGLPGLNGLSAYQVAVQQGFEGTAAEWLASLIGANGESGATFTPCVDADGNLSWSNDKDLPNPSDRNIRGPAGYTPQKGSDYFDGDSVTVSSVSESAEDGGSNVVTFSDGKKLTVKNGKRGATGADGYTPKKGIDYFTEDEVENVKEDSKAFITSELAKRGQLKPEFANSIGECTDTTKLYVLPDGYIYAYMSETGPLFTDHIKNAIDTDGTPFNNGLGIADGYVSVDGSTSGTTSGNTEFYSGFIPYKLENNITISGVASVTKTTPSDLQIGRIFFYGADKSTMVQSSFFNDYISEGAATYDPKGYNGSGVLTFDLAKYTQLHGWYGGEIASKAKYIRIGWYLNPSKENAHVLFNEEIAFGATQKWASTGHAFVPADYEDRIVAVEALTASHDERIKAMESYGASSVSGTEIPAYIKAEAEEVMARLVAKQGNRVFNMIAMSDFHYSNYSAKYGGEVDDNRATLLSVAKASSYMLDRIHIDAVATLGDNTPFGAVTEAQVEWAHTWHKEINEILTLTQRPGVVDFRTVGNHDRLGGNDTDGNPTPILPDGAVYQYIQGYNRQCDYLSTPVGYGYKDFEGYKLRVIVLNTAECEGKGRFDGPYYGFFMGNAQYNWLIHKGLDLSGKEDASQWQILILSHHRADDAQVATDGNSWHQNAFILPNILHAYKTGGSYSGAIASEGISVSCNFAGKNQARLIGQIHGHHHNHKYFPLYLGASDNSTQTDIMAVGIPTTGYGTTNPDNNGVSYTSTAKGTADETTFNVCAIDLDAHKIYAINYGKGIDREIDY